MTSIRDCGALFKRAVRVVVGISAPMAILAGCGSAPDSRFAAETYDEYTEPLTNAVIGTPEGVTAIGPAAVPAQGAGSSPGAAAATDAGVVFGDGGPAIDAGSPGGFGFWHFDDCSPTSNFLVDSSGFGANAQHALNGSCVPGITGLGVNIRTAKDVVQVPDEPQFTVGQRVAVAAWVHPNTVTGDQPIVIKRLNNQTAFSLGIHNGNIEMSVVLTSGTTVISRAPIQPGVWSHVGGLFDGTFVFLFLNGQQFGQVFGAGTIRNVFAPIRIGATTQSQHFDGIIDDVFLSTEPASAATITSLACITQPTTFSVNPAVGGPVPFDTNVHYDITVNDNDVGFCPSSNYEAFFENFDPTLNSSLNPSFATLNPGQSTTFGADVSATDEADPGTHFLPFIIFRFGNSFEEQFGQLTLLVSQPTGCFVSTPRELMIRDVSVVDDPVRTFGQGISQGGGGDGGVIFQDGGFTSSTSFTTGTFASGTGGGGSATFGSGSGGGSSGIIGSSSSFTTVTVSSTSTTFGSGPGSSSSSSFSTSSSAPPDPNNPSLRVWTFGNLIRNVAPTEAQAAQLTEALFDHWLSDQMVNGFTVAARPAMQTQVLNIWPRTPTGELDLDRAPLRLQAIVNRVDLRDLSNGSAGEGRFVFAFDGQFGFPQQFTVILEYNLPAKTPQDVTDWANAWHSLSSHPFPSEEYNAALETLTRRFIGRGADPNGVNGSALHQLRTNEIALSDRWELREFVLSPTTGFFDENTVRETPDLSFNNTPTLGTFINQNAGAIEAVLPGSNGNSIPLALPNGTPFRAGSVFNDLIEWNAPGIANNDDRFHMSIDTCNGCHGPETGTTFLQITPRFPGSEATLSPFLTGTTVFDVNGQARTLNDLGRRRTDLTDLVCADGGAPPPPPPPPSDGGVVDAGKRD
jgi:Concanavalin A-like lectin/glucanases superfamily